MIASPRWFLPATALLALSIAGPAIAQPETTQILIINEVDADQAGTDSAEFVEIYDGGIGNLSLADHVIVFYNGNGDVSYQAFDLDGFSTDANGYFVLCGNAANTPNCDLDVSPDTDLIQNGADAVAVYFGSAAQFPNGTAVTTLNLDDALVYDTNDADDAELLALLNPGQAQINEAGGGDSTLHSNQRCPNGSGNPRETIAFEQWAPTPGEPNVCEDAPATDPLINEFVANHTGTDASEYIEVLGDADTDYSAFTLLEVEGDSGGTGFVDEVITVGTTDGGGFWDTGFLNNAIENGSITLLLVDGFTGMAGADLDADDNGTVDTPPWSGIVDCVAVDDGGASDLHYCSTVLDSTLEGGSGFSPGGASRIPDGADTDTPADWVRNDFDGAGIPALDPGTPDEGEALNTPGAMNALVPGEAAAIVINEIMQNPAAVADGSGEWFELYNPGPDPVDINGWTIADAGIDSHLINNGGPLTIPAGGFLVLGNNADMGTNGGVNVAYNYGGSWFLANGDDEVVLLDGAMSEIDRVEYDGGPNFPDPTGASMALIDPGFDNNIGSNWCTATTTFGAGDAGTPGSVNDCEGSPIQILINEVDADTEGTDALEFIELFDGGGGSTPLDGLVVVLFNGSDDQSYEPVFDLDGFSTDANGYFTICNAAVAGCGITFNDNSLQNGADAVALFEGDAADFPNDTPVTATNLVDAIVYDTGDADDSGLIDVLTPGQPQVDENGAGNQTGHSNQRCPNGTGGPRITTSYEQWPPTPGAENACMDVVVPPVCGDTKNATFISAIQGTTDVSPMVGMEVEVEGVVVGDLQGASEYGGLFIQEEDTDADGNPLTSEGLFAFTSLPASMGDRVRVRGTVIEFNGLTELSPTTDVVVCDIGVIPPTPVAVTLPMPALDAFEAIESMSIVMPQALVINDVFTAFRFGELTVSSTRRMQPTFVAAPGAPANAVAAANALDALIVDDRRTGQNLAPPITGQDDSNPLAADNPIRSGQLLTGLSGVMHYAFDAYRVQPTAPFVIDESGNPRTAMPDPVGGTLKVASFNVLNFFTNIDTGAPICGPLMNQDCRGADSPEEYDRQLAKLVAAIGAIDADVVGLIELENNASDSLQALVDAVNAAVGAGTYEFIDTGTIGGDAIKQGFIYKPASVTPEGDFALLTGAVDARFDDSLNRPALAQSFRATSNLALFTPIVNHLKSKGCSGATGPEADQGDGQSCWNPARTSAAEALRDWANSDPTGTGSDAVLIIGDLNSYRLEDPIAALEAGGFTNLEYAFGGPGAYSYVFFGQIGSLDYALSSAALTPKVTGAVPWNINADEIVSLDYNTEFDVLPSFYAPTAYRSSDHDPVIVGLDLNPPSVLTIPTLAAGVDATIEITGDIGKCGFSAAEFVDPATLTPPPPANLSFPYGVLSFTAERCNTGATATIEVELPPIPNLLAVLKHTDLGGWMFYPYQLNGSTLVFQVTDGGSGDQDGAANGVIVDPIGPAVVAGGGERATFRVTKVFSDGNPADVNVTLTCNTGLPLMQDAMIAEGEHVEFVLGDFQVGEPDCSVSETVPDGYAPAHDAGVGNFGIAGAVISGDEACEFIDVSNGQFTCAITNTLQAVDITIFKEWIDEHPEYDLPEFVEIELSCSGLGFVGAQYIAPGSPGEFSVLPHYDGTICKVKEERQVGVISDIDDCKGEGALTVYPGQDAECTIVNTRIYAGIPTLSQYGLMLLAALMLMMGAVAVRRFG